MKNIRIVTVLFFLISNGQARLCSVKFSVDITDGDHMPNGDIYHREVKYSESDYVTDKNNTIRGCVCNKKICEPKCCPSGHGFHMLRKTCMSLSDVSNALELDEYMRTENDSATKSFHFIYGTPDCLESEIPIPISFTTNLYNSTSDGKLYTEVKHHIPPFLLKTPDKYCLDTFVTEKEDGTTETRLDALVCLATDKPKDQNLAISSSCMLISCVFIILTLAVYIWVPELRNLHGLVLMSYLMCLLVAFAFLATMQIMLLLQKITDKCCFVFTIIIYFSLECAFFWLNVMCFDIWWTFSGKGGMTMKKLSVRGKFCAYSIYAFGVPTLLTIILLALEFSGLPPHPLLPSLKIRGCFISGTSRLLYLYGPIVILWFANLLFFILTAIKIVQIKKQTSVLKSQESATHDRHSKDRQRLALYVKLFIVMGINWLLEVISSIYSDADSLWSIIDAYNVLIGLFIFIIFVCKKKIFRLIKKRYHQARGDSMSKSQTSTRTFSSTRDEIALNQRD